jgi:hypothetical protein
LSGGAEFSGQSLDPQFSSLPVLAAEHKLTVGSEATCSVLPGDYSGHRASFVSSAQTFALVEGWQLLY